MAAPQQLSSAIKEECGLTEEEVDLIRASTARSARVNAATNVASRAVARDDNVILNVLVPTSDRLDEAKGIVAIWEVKEPSADDISGKETNPYLNATTVVEMIYKLYRDLKLKKDVAETAIKIRTKAIAFVKDCLTHVHDDKYVIWDATSISKEVICIAEDGSTSYETESPPLSSEADNYCQVQLALAYRAQGPSFYCGYSYVYQSGELPTAITNSGTPQRINSIRILYANLLANDLNNKSSNQVKLVASNKPYPGVIDE